jgi:abequosyltransferase
LNSTAPLLSICIATHNRASFIGETLDSIVPQLSEEVELVIVDGASTDQTQSVVERAASLSPFVRYVRLAEKGGVDRDFCRAVEIARGNYCWLFADDDLINPGAVDAVLAEIQKGYDVIIVNATAVDLELSHILKASLLELEEDAFFGPDELERLFVTIIPYVSFIGCVVIDRHLWLKREKDVYLGTEFIHVGVIFQAPLPRGAKVLARPTVTLRYGNAQWSGRAAEIWLRTWPRLLWSFETISESVKCEKARRWSWKSLKAVVVWRAVGSYSPPTFRSIVDGNVVPLWWKTLAWGVTLLPKSPLNAVLLGYFKSVRKQDWMAIYDLSRSRFNCLQ